MSLYKDYSYIEVQEKEIELVKYKRYTISERIAADKIYKNWLKMKGQKIGKEIKIKSEKELDEEYWATHMSSRPRKYTSLKKY